VTLGWCVIGTWISLKLASAVVELRVGADEEREGLDVSQHGEAMGT
jgi:Amt family ammonium transporter